MRQSYLPGVGPVLVIQYRVAKPKTIDTQTRTESGGCNHKDKRHQFHKLLWEYMKDWREKREGELWLLFN